MNRRERVDREYIRTRRPVDDAPRDVRDCESSVGTKVRRGRRASLLVASDAAMRARAGWTNERFESMSLRDANASRDESRRDRRARRVGVATVERDASSSRCSIDCGNDARARRRAFGLFLARRLNRDARTARRSPTDDERRSMASAQATDMVSRRKSKSKFAPVGKRPAKKFDEVFATVETPMRRGVDFPMEPRYSVREFRSWIEREVKTNPEMKRIMQNVDQLFTEYDLKARQCDEIRRDIRDLALGLYEDAEGGASEAAVDADALVSEVLDVDVADAELNDQERAMQRCLAADARHRDAVVGGAGTFNGTLRRVVAAMRRRRDGVAEADLRHRISVIRREAQKVIEKSYQRYFITEKYRIDDWFARRGSGTVDENDDFCSFYASRLGALDKFTTNLMDCFDIRFKDITKIKYAACGFLTASGERQLMDRFQAALARARLRGANDGGGGEKVAEIKTQTAKLQQLIADGRQEQRKMQRWLTAFEVCMEAVSFVDAIVLDFLNVLLERSTSDAAAKRALNHVLDPGFEERRLADLIVYIAQDFCFQGANPTSQGKRRTLLKRIHTGLEYDTDCLASLDEHRGRFVQYVVAILSARHTDTAWSDMVDAEARSEHVRENTRPVPQIIPARLLRNYIGPRIVQNIRLAMAARISSLFNATIRAEVSKMQLVDSWLHGGGAVTAAARAAARTNAANLCSFMQSRKRRESLFKKIKRDFIRTTLKDANYAKIPKDRRSPYLDEALARFGVDAALVAQPVVRSLRSISSKVQTKWLYPKEEGTTGAKAGLLPIASFGTSAYGYAEDIGLHTLLSVRQSLLTKITSAREALGANAVAPTVIVPAIRDDDVIRAFLMEEVLQTLRQRLKEHALFRACTQSTARLLRGAAMSQIFSCLLNEIIDSERHSSTMPLGPFFTNDPMAYVEDARVSLDEASSSDALTSKQKESLTQALTALSDQDVALSFGNICIQRFLELARALAGLDELSAVACAARDAALRGLDPGDSISRARRRKAIRAMRDAIGEILPEIFDRELPSAASAPDAAVAATPPATDPPTTSTPVGGETDSGTTPRYVPPRLKKSAVLINVSLERRQTAIDRTCAGEMFYTYAVGRDVETVPCRDAKRNLASTFWFPCSRRGSVLWLKSRRGRCKSVSRRSSSTGRGSRRRTRNKSPSPTTHRTRSRRRRPTNGAPSSSASIPV